MNVVSNKMIEDSKVASYVLSIIKKHLPGSRVSYGKTVEFIDEHAVLRLFEIGGSDLLDYVFRQTTTTRSGTLEPEFMFPPFPSPGYLQVAVEPYKDALCLVSDVTNPMYFPHQAIEDLMMRDNIKLFRQEMLERAEEYVFVRIPEKNYIRVIVANKSNFFDVELSVLLQKIVPFAKKRTRPPVEKVIPEFNNTPSSHFAEASDYIGQLNDSITTMTTTKKSHVALAEVYIYQQMLLSESSEALRNSGYHRTKLLRILARQETYDEFFALYNKERPDRPRYRFYMFLASLMRMKTKKKLIHFFVRLFHYLIESILWKEVYGKMVSSEQNL
jgi:hypothetical protein